MGKNALVFPGTIPVLGLRGHGKSELHWRMNWFCDGEKIPFYFFLFFPETFPCSACGAAVSQSFVSE
jgi:hypothetical protein